MTNVPVDKLLPPLLTMQGGLAEILALMPAAEVPEEQAMVRKWEDVKLGGGGYITNVARDPVTGMLFAGTDVQNCYLRRPGDARWATVFRRDTMAPEDMVRTKESNDKGHSLASCMGAFAGGEGKRLYSHINAKVFTIDLDPAIPLTEPGGIKCKRWNLPLKYMQPNLNIGKFSSPGMAGHPTDKDVALLGTWNDGGYSTSDGGNTVQQLDVPVGFGSAGVEKGRERYLVWIDQTNPANCYVFCQGTGLHRSTTGVAGPYTLVTGGPKMAVNLFGEPDGTLWVCGDGRIPNATGSAYISGVSADGGLWTLKGDSWAFVGNPMTKWATYPWHVAVAPYLSAKTGGKVVLAWAEQVGTLSQNGGTSWFNMENASTAAVIEGGEADWRRSAGLRMGGGFTFTENYGEIIGGEGFGVIRDADFLTPTLHPDYPVQKEVPRILAQDMSAGIEEFIVNNIFVNPANGRIFLNCWDRHIVEVADLNDYTARVMMPVGARLSIAHGMDNAIDDPDYYVVSAGSGTPAHSWSQGGRLWTQFAVTLAEKQATYPDSAGNGSAGAIAMSTRDDIVICQSNNLPAIESRGSRVFRRIALNGRMDYSTINSYTTAYRKNVAADKTRPGVFAMVVPMTVPGVQNAVNNVLGGLWVRPGIDKEWVQTIVGDVDEGGENIQFWGCHLQYIPDHSGEMLYTGYIGQADAPLVHWKDDGRVRSNLPNIANVLAYGFGRGLPDRPYPGILALGKFKGERGYWESFDLFETAEKISDEFPNNYWSAGTTCIEGDMTEIGKWFVPVGGKGAVFARRVAI
jgi:hypothetical protein